MPAKNEMQEKMAKLRAMRGKSHKKSSRNSRLKSQVKDLTKMLKEQGKTIARMAKHVIPKPKPKRLSPR